MRTPSVRAVLASLFLALSSLALAPPAAMAIGPVAISQVYGGGGNTGATLKNDFIELHNISGAPVNITGWTVQYASAAGSSWSSTALSGTIPAGGYYLVQEAAGVGGVPGPTPDASGTIAMSATAGKVALVSNATLLALACPTGGAIVDFVGYGAAATCFEGTPTATLSNTTAALRGNSGCTDTDDNGSDFAVGAAAPRNSATTPFLCVTVQRTLDVTVAGSGSVTKDPDQATYDDGSLVELTATPDPGWHFVDWSGDASGSTNPLSVTMDADKSITATFAINTYTLDVTVVGNGSVAKNPDQANYDHGSLVDLTPTPDPGWHFVGWSGDASGSANPLQVTMDGNKNITATFAINTYTLDVTTVGNGGVAKAPDQATYDHGSLVDLTATPDPGWNFVDWSGDASGSANPLQVTMDGNKNITATFAINTYTLSVATIGNGGVAKAPDQASYAHGSLVDLTATADPGWHFVGWSGDASGSLNPLTVTMDGNKSITATFEQDPVLVVSQVYGGGGNTGAQYQNDYIELYNRGPVAVNLTGWSVQYASAAGTTWATTPLSGSIVPGGYYLVQEAAGVNVAPALPTPDATGSIAMSATAGKVALVNGLTALTGACPSGAEIEDLVGYGAASCAEGSPAPSLSNTTAALRKSGGCVDTDDNLADFLVGAPNPRNTASPLNGCEGSLVVVIDPPGVGTVAVSPDLGSYPNGTPVQLTATALLESGYHFVNWSGDASGSANPLNIVMSGDRTITAHFAPNTPVGHIVISQVYGGGGNGAAPFLNDYVELYNRGSLAVDITGWSLQYASANGSSWASTNLIGTIQPGGYYLIQQQAGGGTGGPLPAPNGIGVINLSATSGKLALVNNGVVLTGGCPSGSNIIDMLGYGSADCSEGASPSVAADNASALYRNSNGCDDSDVNSADFALGTPVPRNSASPVNICSEWLAVDEGTANFTLGNAVPNPARGFARIPFALPRESDVRLEVLDIQGRVAATLASGRFPAGRHDARWDGTGGAGQLPPGVYLVRLRVAGTMLVRRVTLMR